MNIEELVIPEYISEEEQREKRYEEIRKKIYAIERLRDLSRFELQDIVVSMYSIEKYSDVYGFHIYEYRDMIRQGVVGAYQRGWTSPYKAVQRLVQVELSLVAFVHNKILPVEILRVLKTFLK